MAEPRGLRVGDAEREAVAAGLREHFAHGRLTMEEFQQRVDATFAAKTDLDLAQITRDLPAISGAAAGSQPWQPPWHPQPWQQQPWDRQAWDRQAGQRQPSSGGPRQALPGAAIMLLWLVALFLVLPGLFAGLLLTRFLATPLVVIILVLVFGRRLLRRAGRPGPWSGKRRYRRRW